MTITFFFTFAKNITEWKKKLRENRKVSFFDLLDQTIPLKGAYLVSENFSRWEVASH